MNKKYKAITFCKDKGCSLIDDLKKKLVGWEDVNEDFEYLFLIGGDGTLIKQFKRFQNKNIKIVSISAGENTFIGEEITDDLIKSIESDENFTNFQVFEIKNMELTETAINDIFVSGSLFLECEIYINDILIETFKGYSLLFSSFLGCTAFNKSCNSPIILPSLNGWLLTPLFPQINSKISQLMNPIVLSESENIKLKVISDDTNLFIDNKKCPTDNVIKDFLISIKKSTSKIYFPTTNKKYLEKLKNHFIK